MRAAWVFLRAFLVAAACVASGTLECGGRIMVEQEARGATIYHRMCSVCHGAEGEGYAADNAPAISNARYLAVVTGRWGPTRSAWRRARGGPLGYKDISAVVAYLRTYERYPRIPADDGTSKGDAKRGATAFKARCESCHGERGATGPYVHIGNAELLAVAGNGMLRATIEQGREGTLMPSFRRELGRDGIEDIVAALRSWQAEAPREVRPAPAKPPPLPLGPVPLNPKGPEPEGFKTNPATTPADIVKRELDRGAKMALLDARAQSDYLGEHIKGAVSVPFFDPDPYVAELPKDAWLVCYCACPHAESGQLARKLVDKGFTKVTILDEGLGVWRARKYGTSSGPDP
jgi:cytochrome c oxidase cbb3-type subunit 3/ubiquinol-cytochrome c reductase cytochrome c subunit